MLSCFLGVFATASYANAQNNFSSGLLEALRSSNLSSLAQLVESNAEALVSAINSNSCI